MSRRFDKEATSRFATVRINDLFFFYFTAQFFVLTDAPVSYSARLLSRQLWRARTTRRPRWQRCSRLSPRTGRRLRKKCHSWCRLLALFFPCHVVISLIYDSVRSVAGCYLFFPLSPPFLSQTRIYTNTRGTGFGRGGKPYVPHHQQNERPLPPSYVCYRCGQKGMLPVTRPLTSRVCLTSGARPLDPRLSDE
jgi:hypothetical protein